jgi:hypothetical protein
MKRFALVLALLFGGLSAMPAASDRACQRECRTRGGPFLPVDTLFPFAD